MYTTLISASQLLELTQSGQPYQVFDCTFDLTQPGIGEQQYQALHIADATYAPLDSALSAHAGAMASGGRHPLPTREAFAAWLCSVGFDNTKQAVVYDRNGMKFCGRLWWMLKWLGHEAVAVLDGNLQDWQQAGGHLSSGPEAEKPEGNFTLGIERARLVAIETVANQLGQPSQTLLDARTEERFKGEVDALDKVAGHIPGAFNRPFSHNLDAHGKFKPAEQLRAEFTQLLADHDPASVVHYCGSGVSAVPNLLAMEVAGLGRTGLYAGSWSQWSSDPTRPIAKG